MSLLSVIAPAVVWGFYKPSRVLVPQLNGVDCAQSHLCLESQATREVARALSENAMQDIEATLGPLSYEPRFIFCSTQTCFERFGFERAAAKTVGTFAIVIGPRGWKDYYLKHELIHQWQYDRLGFVAMLRTPEWLTEGMAYQLSGDPRAVLAEPFQSYRETFSHWYESVDKEHLVSAIKMQH